MPLAEKISLAGRISLADKKPLAERKADLLTAVCFNGLARELFGIAKQFNLKFFLYL